MAGPGTSTPHTIEVAGNGCHLTLRLYHYEHPTITIGEDADWVTAKVEIVAGTEGAFTAKRDVSVFTPDLAAFLHQVEGLLGTLSGEATLDHLEGEFGCHIKLEAGRGNLTRPAGARAHRCEAHRRRGRHRPVIHPPDGVTASSRACCTATSRPPRRREGSDRLTIQQPPAISRQGRAATLPRSLLPHTDWRCIGLGCFADRLDAEGAKPEQHHQRYERHEDDRPNHQRSDGNGTQLPSGAVHIRSYGHRH